MSHPVPSSESRRLALRQSGFTLVELMISMVIGLFIVLALLTLLINVNRNNSEMTKSNRVIENGRFTLQMLEADVSHVGFWAGFVPKFDDLTHIGAPTDVPTAVPDPCLAYGAWDAQYKTNLIGIPLQSYEIPAVVPSPTVPVCAARVVNPQPSTDVLVVRHLEPCIAGVDAGCAAPNATDVYFKIPRCMDNNPLSPNFPQYSTVTYALGTSATLALTPLYKRNCTIASSANPNDGPANPYRFTSSLYYVRNYAVTAGDGVPTLMRSQFTSAAHQAADAVIEGVQGFQVELGLDTVSDSGGPVSFTTAITWADITNLKSPTNRGDGIPDSYVRCTVASPCTADQLMNAVAAKIYVLVRAENQTAGYTDTKSYCLASSCPTAADKLGPFNDHYKRHLFTQTVRLTNVSARRETPP
ncbi:MAG: PilW family protein [Ramlibacter sp.]